MQIDQAERGFSFRFDGPLDMRMDRSCGQTAADIVNTMGETDLANLIYLYGEERHSRRIAAEIARTRADAPFETTKQLADAVRRVVFVSHKDKLDPATRTFQALRIAVNDELGELERLLSVAENILNINGRLVVVTFHSLEDRIVKNFFAERSKPAPTPSRYMPIMHDDNHVPTFRLLSKKPIIACDEETSRNPRARSAKLRVAMKINEPVKAGGHG
jgi:16S rRNA (cytosine1402-N4)-methyltransferase